LLRDRCESDAVSTCALTDRQALFDGSPR